jgi:hypothetical protein
MAEMEIWGTGTFVLITISAILAMVFRNLFYKTLTCVFISALGGTTALTVTILLIAGLDFIRPLWILIVFFLFALSPAMLTYIVLDYYDQKRSRKASLDDLSSSENEETKEQT